MHCHWIREDDDGPSDAPFNAECGSLVVVPTSGPFSDFNEMKFCPFCGGEIILTLKEALLLYLDAQEDLAIEANDDSVTVPLQRLIQRVQEEMK